MQPRQYYLSLQLDENKIKDEISAETSTGFGRPSAPLILKKILPSSGRR